MKRFILLALGIFCLSNVLMAKDPIKIGIIGLDTSHSTAFTQLLNSDEDNPYVRDFEIVAAYPYGSKTIESSYKRIPGYIEEVKKYGVTITNSIAEMLDMVDCVLLETNDGRLHIEQAVEVFKSGKLCYVDKPAGATLGQTIALYKLAEHYGIPIFSSSALRFSPENVKLRNGEYGKILGADCYSPHHPEPTHPDFGFYGIHGVETLYTLMGVGCEKVSRIHSDYGDIVSGVWKDGRLGTFRAVSKGPNIYGGTAITETGTIQAGGYAGYMVLLEQVLNYFKTGVVPIDPKETIELFAFMKASNMSLERGGQEVTLKEAYKAAEMEADSLVREYVDINLCVIDPGHFHANLLQKHPLEGVNSEVRVYAPKGSELNQYLKGVDKSMWTEKVYASKDFLSLLPESKLGDVAMIAGKSSSKTKYIHTCVEKGYNVLADKPMAIDKSGYELLCDAYREADEKGLVVYDLMTERYDTLNILVRNLLSNKSIFGELDCSDGPAVSITSTHHFYKEVSGKPLRRPSWYYDIDEQGEGIADVTTHYVDLVFWQCFPDQCINLSDVSVDAASHFPTRISRSQFKTSTGSSLKTAYVDVLANGSIDFRVKGVPVNLNIIWAWDGEPDTFEAVYKGTNATIKVIQNSTTGYVKELYVNDVKMDVPVDERLGHEDHFALVAGKFLNIVRGKDKMPIWEPVNTLTKYYITTEAVEMAAE